MRQFLQRACSTGTFYCGERTFVTMLGLADMWQLGQHAARQRDETSSESERESQSTLSDYKENPTKLAPR